MAAKQDQRPDRRFENPSIPTRVKGKRPMKIPCVATVVDKDGGPVDGWEVNFFRRAEKLATQTSADGGKVGGDIDVLEAGIYRIEMEMFDTQGKRVVFLRDVIVEEEKEEKPKRKIFLKTEPIQHSAGYDIVVLTHDENFDPILEEVAVTLRDPRKSKVSTKKTKRGVARFTDIPFPDHHMYVEVMGEGRANMISLYPRTAVLKTSAIAIEAEVI